MALSQVSLIQGNLSQNASPSILRSGSQVSGRVIAKNPDGSYSLSLAGQKINVQSSVNLKVGSTFSARVSLNGNKVSLSLIKDLPTSSEGEIVKNISLAAGEKNLSPQLSSLLSSLGFEKNIQSLKILQFMQQMGMKIDVNAAKKALTAFKKNSASQGEKAEISLLLQKKGLPGDEERVNEILGQNQQNHGQNQQNDSQNKQDDGQNQQNDNQNQQNDSQNHRISYDEDTKSYLNDRVKKYFKSLDEASLVRQKGILSSFNSIKSKKGEDAPLRHWLIFPFDWEFQKSRGNFRFLFDSDLKNLEKLIIDLKNDEKESIFVLYFKKGQLERLNFSARPEGPAHKTKKEIELLQSMFQNNVQIEHESFETLQGFACGDEELSLVRGEL